MVDKPVSLYSYISCLLSVKVITPHKRHKRKSPRESQKCQTSRVVHGYTVTKDNKLYYRSKWHCKQTSGTFGIDLGTSGFDYVWPLLREDIRHYTVTAYFRFLGATIKERRYKGCTWTPHCDCAAAPKLYCSWALTRGLTYHPW